MISCFNTIFNQSLWLRFVHSVCWLRCIAFALSARAFFMFHLNTWNAWTIPCVCARFFYSLHFWNWTKRSVALVALVYRGFGLYKALGTCCVCVWMCFDGIWILILVTWLPIFWRALCAANEWRRECDRIWKGVAIPFASFHLLCVNMSNLSGWDSITGYKCVRRFCRALSMLHNNRVTLCVSLSNLQNRFLYFQALT